MADNLKVYEDRLRKAGGKTGDVRDRINSVLLQLEAAIANRGEPWGDDKIGDRFANGDSGYKKSRDGLTDSTENMAETFGNFSTAQVKAANDIRDMDHGNGDTYR
ncbi:hypothetical protein [Nocardia sp. NPDC050710]|uniref:hypothetical protein n=1 Tax=Nocardia sp. NPDC050710 TaxID=3157220 RepID=UPI0033E50968